MKSSTFKYTIYGAAFGFAFPVVATLFDIFMSDLEFTWSSIQQVQSNQPLHWIIDSAPLFLGLFASFAGKHQDKLHQLNDLQEQIIEERTKDLQLSNSDLRSEIETRIQIESDLILAKEDAIQSQKAEERFLANMSHEIRTPLNGIVGFTRLLFDTQIDDKQTEYLKSLKYSSNHLLAIINDILELSKIKAGQIEFESNPICTKELFASVVNTVIVGASSKGLNLVLDIDETVPKGFIGDQVRISQIVLNLLNNAVKFTTHGEVRFKLSFCEPDNFRFEISDTGIGIAADKLDAIFEDFKQAETSTTRLFGGTGLGLSITKKLVEIQGGKINVTSSLGEGSTFSFTLNLKPCDPPSLSDDPFNDIVRSEGRLEARILLAEDNDMNRLLAQNVFEQWGNEFKVDYAKNGKEAIEMMFENDYDLILMDLQMPIMDGYTACEFIRNNMESPKRDIPIIALTADALPSERKRAFQVGMNDHLTKPFRPEDLFAKILKCVSV